MPQDGICVQSGPYCIKSISMWQARHNIKLYSMFCLFACNPALVTSGSFHMDDAFVQTCTCLNTEGDLDNIYASRSEAE